MSAGAAPGPTPTAVLPRASGRRDAAGLGRSWDGRVLLALALAIVVAIADWAWNDWQQAVKDAGAEFIHVAQTNSLRMSLLARDARRLEESVDKLLTEGKRVTGPLLGRELAERFKGGEIADFVPADPDEPIISTSAAPVDRAIWREQLGRVQVVSLSVLGWAYQRGPIWMLPVFYRRTDGGLLVVSLPVSELTAEWAVPNVPGESPLGMRGFDERILLRKPFTPAMLGADGSKGGSAKAVRAAQLSGHSSGYVVTPATETDRVVRLIAWVEVPGADARVIVATARSNLFERWLRQRSSGFALALALLLASVAVVAWTRGRLKAATYAQWQSRRAAEESAELTQLALDASRDTTWQLDLTTGAMRFGEDLDRLLGWTAPAAETDPGTGTPTRRSLEWLLERVSVGDRERLRQAVARACAEGEPVYEEFSVAAPTGGGRHVVLKGRPAAGREGELAVGTLRDVTRLVASQNEASRNLHTLQRMCSLARIGPWTVDPRTGTLEMGPGAREIYDLAPDAPLGNWFDFPGADADAMEPLMAARQRLLRDGIGYDLVLPLRLAGGTRRWIRSTAVAVRAPGGQIERIDGALQDVTAAIERDSALRETQERYELATHNARIGIWEFDFKARSTSWNDVMYELTGFPAEADPPRGARMQRYMHADDREPTLGAFRRAARDPTVSRAEFEFRFERTPGEYRWLRNQCAFERDDQGRPTRAVGTLLDVTLGRELSQERQARAEAEARSAAKTAFVSSMSHELRTPLNAVIGYAQLLNNSRTDDPQMLRARVQRIEAAGWHLLALIDEILDLARIEGGNARMEVERVALGEVVADAIDLVAPQSEGRGIAVHSALQPAWVMGDAKRLRQVALNLLSNAVKYNVEGGTVHVELRLQDGQAQLEVRDTGLGMTPQQLAQLYQPFNRLGREATNVQGTGIGLAITKTLIERMGGTIGASSQPGQGTTFRVALPLTDAGVAADTARGDEPALPPPKSSLKVLIVEDNEVNALLLEESIHLLQPLWTVRRASTLSAASLALDDEVPDATFLDQNLPDGSGLDWLSLPEVSVRRDRMEVVMVTANAMPELRQHALDVGVTSVLCKPFALSELRDLLGRLAR